MCRFACLRAFVACACAFSLLSWVCGQEGSTKTSWWFIIGKTQLTPSLPPNYFRRGNQSLPTATLNNRRQTSAALKCSRAMPWSNSPLSWLPYGSSARKTKASLGFLVFVCFFFFLLPLCDSDAAVLIAVIEIINWLAMKAKVAEWEEKERGRRCWRSADGWKRSGSGPETRQIKTKQYIYSSWAFTGVFFKPLLNQSINKMLSV